MVLLILTLIGIQVFVQIIHGSSKQYSFPSINDQSLLLLNSDTSSKTIRIKTRQEGHYLKNFSTLDLYNPYYHPVMDILPQSSPLSSSSSELFELKKKTYIQQNLKQENLEPITVGLVTILPLSGEAKHFLYDGIQQSQYLQLVGVVSLYNDARTRNETNNNNNNNNDDGDGDNNNIDNYNFNFTILSSLSSNTREGGENNGGYVDPSLVQLWIVDGQRVAKLKNRQFLSNILHHPSPTWKVLIVDYTDRFQFQLRHYFRLNVLLQQELPGDSNRDTTNNAQQQQSQSQRQRHDHVRLAVRSIVRGRYFDTTKNRINVGQVMENIETSGGLPTLHCPYAVRTDTVNAVRAVLLAQQQQPQQKQQQEQDYPSESTSTTTNLIPIFTASNRPLDVLHLWNLSSKEGKSQLRNSVSRAVLSWNGTTITTTTSSKSSTRSKTTTTTTTTLQTSIEERGIRRRTGRNTVTIEYIQGMLQSKIVIVTQKDDWEDHYRLFESLICGPLVITDYMLTLPRGLQNGTHLLMFTSIDELYHYVTYYLTHEVERQTIASKGYTIAMNQHRSWHRLEELIFGIPLTNNIIQHHNNNYNYKKKMTSSSIRPFQET